MLVDFNARGQQGMGFSTGGGIIMIVDQKRQFEVKTP